MHLRTVLIELTGSKGSGQKATNLPSQECFLSSFPCSKEHLMQLEHPYFGHILRHDGMIEHSLSFFQAGYQHRSLHSRRPGRPRTHGTELAASYSQYWLTPQTHHSQLTSDLYPLTARFYSPSRIHRFFGSTSATRTLILSFFVFKVPLRQPTQNKWCPFCNMVTGLPRFRNRSPDGNLHSHAWVG